MDVFKDFLSHSIRNQKLLDLSTALTQNDDEETTPKPIDYDQPDIDRAEELFLSHPLFLRQLKRLDVSGNAITDVPADFGILNASLESLSIAHNSLVQVGTSLCRGFAHLRSLDLSHNRIRELGDKLRELASLETLDLSYNQLGALSHELCNELKSLRELNLSNNSIETLPLFRPPSSTSVRAAQPVKSASKLSNGGGGSRSITPRSNLNQSPSRAIG